jgi:hypothetical protein
MKSKDYKPALDHLQKVLKAKRIFRRQLIALSYFEKIQRVIEMQRIASQFKRDSSRKHYIWNID